MVKADLRDTYPFGLFAVPMSEVVRLHASSGTTGKPIVVGYTRSDLEVWMEVVKRAFASCGLTRDDVIQVSYGYGCSPAGWARTTARRRSARRWFRPPAGTLSARSC